MKRQMLDAKGQREWRANRLKEARTEGSGWVFFRNGDDKMKDPWCGLEIEIITAWKINGRWIYNAICTQPKQIRAGARVQKVRRVKYSELW